MTTRNAMRYQQCWPERALRRVFHALLFPPVARRNVHLAGTNYLGVRHFRSKPDRLEAGLSPRLDQERCAVLMSQMLGHVRKIRSEGNGWPEPKHISLAARFLSDLCEVILAPVHSPNAVTEVACAWRINGIHDDAGALGMFGSGGGLVSRCQRATPAVVT